MIHAPVTRDSKLSSAETTTYGTTATAYSGQPAHVLQAVIAPSKRSEPICIKTFKP